MRISQTLHFSPQTDPFQLVFVLKNIGFGGSGPFCYFFEVFFDVKNVRFDKNEISVRYLF